jgi:uncharacterized small protein (DUF1192 family)
MAMAFMVAGREGMDFLFGGTPGCIARYGRSGTAARRIQGWCDIGKTSRYPWRTDERRRAMPAADEDDRPKRRIAHEIGQDLALLSVGELNERVALLRTEIERLEAALARKQASRNVADQVFKK